MTNPTQRNQGGTQNQQSPAPKQTGGDNRTPDKTIGQVKYADHHGDPKAEKVGEGGAGKKETSPIEPEKQGGIGGP